MTIENKDSEPFNGNYLDSEGNVKNIDGMEVTSNVNKDTAPFNGNFIDSEGNVRNIDSLQGGGSDTEVRAIDVVDYDLVEGKVVETFVAGLIGTDKELTTKDYADQMDSGIPDAPQDNTAYVRKDLAWENPSKADVGLDNVDNTADLAKPISQATQEALDEKANDSEVVHEAPIDGKAYSRKDATWAETTLPEIPIAITDGGTGATSATTARSNLGAIAEAPDDDKEYVRKNETWVELETPPPAMTITNCKYNGQSEQLLVSGTGFKSASDSFYILIDGKPYEPTSYDESSATVDVNLTFGDKYSISAINESKTSNYFILTAVDYTFIEYKINLDSLDYAIPTNYNQNASYNWEITVNGNSATSFTATGTSDIESAGISLNDKGIVLGKNIIKIEPTDGFAYGWGRAFSYSNQTSGANQYKATLTEVINDPDEAHLESSTTTGVYFRGYQYYNCTSLVNAQSETLPDTVITVSDYFRYTQYNGCSSLVTVPSEVLPNSVTTIGGNFRYGQYYNCTSLTTAPSEVLPSSVTTIGSDFRRSQYYGCSSLQSAPKEVLPSTITTIGDYFRYTQYSGCASFTTTPNEVLPSTITTIGDYFRGYQYSNCTLLTVASSEVLPSSVTTIGTFFRRSQYYNCPSLRTSAYIHDYHFATLLNANTYNYYQMFYLSGANATADTMPRYYTDSTKSTTNPVTDLTPSSDKNYVANRTGITGYDSLNANWK
jgi:hypothetical protein